VNSYSCLKNARGLARQRSDRHSSDHSRKMSEEKIITLLVECTVTSSDPRRQRPIEAHSRFNLVVKGYYFPSTVKSVVGGKLLPGATGKLTLRAIMSSEWAGLGKGTQLELREGPNTFASGHLLEVLGVE
jgi:hypothetical protein